MEESSKPLVQRRVVHGSDGPAGRVTILPDFGGSALRIF